MHSFILLDRSGSMQTRWTEALSSINAYVEGLNQAGADSKNTVTVATFDTNTSYGTLHSPISPVTTPVKPGNISTTHWGASSYPTNMSTFDIIRNNVPLSSWTNITANEVMPRGGTPLYDATAKLVNLAKQHNSERTVLLIMTDGEENQSTEVNKETAKTMLDDCRSRGWQVIFLGADFNNFAQASSLGNAKGTTIFASAANMANTMRSTATASAAYAATGASINYTDEDRENALKPKV